MFNSVIKFYNLLSNKYKVYYIVLFFSFGVNIILDLLSIAAIFPIIFFIFDKDAVLGSGYYLKLNEYLNNFGLNIQYNNSYSALTTFIIILIIIFAFRTILGILINYFSINLEIKTKVFIKDLLFKNYFSQSNRFKFFKNLATVNRTFSPDIEHTTNFFTGFFLILFDIIFSLMLILTIYIFYGNLLIYFFLFLLILIILYLKLVNTKLARDGVKRQKRTAENFKILQQLYNTTKEIIFYGKEKYFRNYYVDQSNKMFETFFFKIFLNKSIKYLIEFAMFSILSIILIYFLYDGRDLNKIVTEVSIFFIILIRLSPTCLKILSSYQDMKFASKSVDNIFEFLEYKSDDVIIIENIKNLRKISNIKNIFVENLSFKYNDNKEIFSRYNCSFETSKPTFISSKSGTGKTTLISLICGFLKPNKGKILFDKTELITISQFDKNLVGYISQESFLIDDTINSNITFGLKNEKINHDRLKYIKSELGITEKNFGKNFDQNKIGENGSNLSGGQKQRISLARLMYQNPKLIILDEATNSLDKDSELEVYKNIFNWGKNDKIFICISHNIPTLLDIKTIKLD
tara:strand:+ start:10296 stop:12020 length:1725 start_codon:yes stop_codon:yes gene_type:complete